MSKEYWSWYFNNRNILIIGKKYIRIKANIVLFYFILRPLFQSQENYSLLEFHFLKFENVVERLSSRFVTAMIFVKSVRQEFSLWISLTSLGQESVLYQYYIWWFLVEDFWLYSCLWLLLSYHKVINFHGNELCRWKIWTYCRNQFLEIVIHQILRESAKINFLDEKIWMKK